METQAETQNLPSVSKTLLIMSSEDFELQCHALPSLKHPHPTHPTHTSSNLHDIDNLAWNSSMWDQGNAAHILDLQLIDVDEETPRSTRLHIDSHF